MRAYFLVNFGVERRRIASYIAELQTKSSKKAGLGGDIHPR